MRVCCRATQRAQVIFLDSSTLSEFHLPPSGWKFYLLFTSFKTNGPGRYVILSTAALTLKRKCNLACCESKRTVLWFLTSSWCSLCLWKVVAGEVNTNWYACLSLHVHSCYSLLNLFASISRWVVVVILSSSLCPISPSLKTTSTHISQSHSHSPTPP